MALLHSPSPPPKPAYMRERGKNKGGARYFPGGASGKELACQGRRLNRHWLDPWVRKIPWRRDRLPTPVFLDFPCGSGGKESTCNVGDLGLIPVLRRSPGEGKGYPVQYSGLENSMDYPVHGVAESDTTE